MACLPTYKNQRFKTMKDLFESIDINDLPKEVLDYLINKYDWNNQKTTKQEPITDSGVPIREALKSAGLTAKDWNEMTNEQRRKFKECN